MASFFGEVRPLVSRAIDDEEVDILPNYKISMEMFDEKSSGKTKLMIVSVGEIASIFVKSHFLREESNLISSIKYSYERDDDDSVLYTGMQNSTIVMLSAVSMYRLCPDVLICDVSKSVSEEMCYEVTDLIFNNYLPSEVLLLTAKHMASFKGENSVHSKSSFLKSLCTSYYTDSYACNIPRLNPPNYLTSMTASILQRCEIGKIPAVCFINFMDTDAVDYSNVHIFDDILKEAIISQVPVNTDAKEKIIKFIKTKQSTLSNLYA